MSYSISEHRMKRMQAMSSAKMSITDAMSSHRLTAMEWVQVLKEVMERMIKHGLDEEWSADES